MTEFSMLWETNGGVGDGVNEYNQDEANLFFRDFSIIDTASMGVLSGIDNELAVTGTATPLSVNTGKAIVYGFRYWNDASLSLAVSTPLVGTTGGRVVLRVDWSANTVRAVVITSSDGVAAIPALTQIAGTTWEISLASFTITTGGVITVTDTRAFALSPLAGMVKLREFTGDGSTTICNFANLQSNLSHLLIVGHGRAAGAFVTGGVQMRFNGDSGGNYDYASAVSNVSVPAMTGSFNKAVSNILAAWITGASGGANYADAFRIQIPDYAQTVLYKTAISEFQAYGDGLTTNFQLGHVRGWWKNTAAINQIQLISTIGNWVTGSKITLYGKR